MVSAAITTTEISRLMSRLTAREQAELDSLLRDDPISYARAHPAGLAPLCFETDTHEPMRPQPFHRKWLDAALQHRTLALIAARGHGKSQYYSGVLAAWQIGNNPALRIIHITSTDELARMYSRHMQRVIDSPAFRAVFPGLPGHGAEWTERTWELDVPGRRDPTWRCAGRCGSVTGGRADIIICDDVVTYENARTENERKKTLEWFQQTLMPMLVPQTGRLMVIGSRYHEEDLYATLLESGMPALVYPAEDEQGRILWPERFTRADLDELQVPPKGSTSSYTTQYLCRPVSAHGEVFNPDWFNVVPSAPPLKEIWWSWDTAVSEDTTADYTAGVLGGLGEDGDAYILDVRRGQWAPTRSKTEVMTAWNNSKPAHGQRLRGVLYEDTKEGRVLKQWIAEAQPGIPLVPMKPDSRDKYTRACIPLPFCEAGRVHLVAGPYVDDLKTEIKSFTADERHAHDDQVDALVYLLIRLFDLQGQRRTPRVRRVQF